jgi:HAD superfamily hydrolase (TIGR01459 family)
MSMKRIDSQVVDGLLAVADRYDGFVFDQFGVLHDGNKLYSQVLPVLQKLVDAGKKILVLSNSGRSADYNLDRIVSLGINRHWIDAIITSGDTAKGHHLPQYVQKKGPKCYHISSPNEASGDLLSAVEGLKLVDDIDQCDFIYQSGMPEGLAENWQSDLLPRLVASQVPLLCSNPDFVALGGKALVTSPGTIARAYQDAGGPVELVGKPNPFIYEAVREQLDTLGCRKVMFIGDSYHHDVLGAHQAGFETFLVLTGVHHAMFKSDDILQTAQADLFTDGVAPSWISKTL